MNSLLTKIEENVSRLREDVSRMCQRLDRDPRQITIVAVTKLASQELIQQALEGGITDIAENKVQEALKKYPGLKGPSGIVRRHFIGHLQTNKVKDAVKIFDMIQSVDSLRLAQELEKHSQKLGRPLDILIQVNCSGEKQKFGIGKSGALSLIEAVEELKDLRVLGLMTIAPLTDDERVVRQCFQDLKRLRDRVQKEFAGSPHVQMKFLSMGMTGDYSVALEEGSNMIRIGRAIFGEVNKV